MLLIPCPNCGERDEREFHYGGNAIRYPELGETKAVWHGVLQQRECAETIREFWYHQSGCECWFEISRNLTTHEFES